MRIRVRPDCAPFSLVSPVESSAKGMEAWRSIRNPDGVMRFALGSRSQLARKVPCSDLGFVPDECLVHFVPCAPST
jgi:hypothetical protein